MHEKVDSGNCARLEFICRSVIAADIQSPKINPPAFLKNLLDLMQLFFYYDLDVGFCLKWPTKAYVSFQFATGTACSNIWLSR